MTTRFSNYVRDVLNEKPTEDERMAVQENIGRSGLGREAVIHTSVGDIFLKLLTDDTLKSVENFCTNLDASLFGLFLNYGQTLTLQISIVN